MAFHGGCACPFLRGALVQNSLRTGRGQPGTEFHPNPPVRWLRMVENLDIFEGRLEILTTIRVCGSVVLHLASQHGVWWTHPYAPACLPPVTFVLQGQSQPQPWPSDSLELSVKAT